MSCTWVDWVWSCRYKFWGLASIYLRSDLCNIKFFFKLFEWIFMIKWNANTFKYVLCKLRANHPGTRSIHVCQCTDGPKCLSTLYRLTTCRDQGRQRSGRWWGAPPEVVRSGHTPTRTSRWDSMAGGVRTVRIFTKATSSSETGTKRDGIWRRSRETTLCLHRFGPW